jgi:hypothetical protein
MVQQRGSVRHRSVQFEECAFEGDLEMIKKMKDGYRVLSSKGKNMGGPYRTLEEAKKRLREVEYFKHHKA